MLDHPNQTSWRKGHVPWNRGKRGCQLAWNKGLNKRTDLRVLKISTALAGRPHPWQVGRSGYNRGRIVPTRERKLISASMRRARRTYAPIWNKGLSKKDHPGIASAAVKNSLISRGRPRPFLSARQGIRRFWYYGKRLRLKMRSRWEVAFAHWLDRKGIIWMYEQTTFVADSFSYTPDFYLPKEHKFVEVKGWLDKNVDAGVKFSALRTRWRVKLDVLDGFALQKLGLLDAHHRVIAKK